jgi:hypothetical protein
MRIGQLMDQINEVCEGSPDTEMEVALDTEDGYFGIEHVRVEDGRLIISAGDPEDE